MRLLDRYILKSFLINYLIAFAVLVGLYIVLDMVININDLVEVQDRRASDSSTFSALFSLFAGVVEFYAYQSLLFFTQLSGIIPVAAAAFTIVRLVRQHELIAIMAAGVSLRRVIAPIIVASVALNLAIVPVMQELIIPAIIPKLIRSHDDIGTDGGRSFEVRGLRDPSNNRLLASRFIPAQGGSTPLPPRMLLPTVLISDETGNITSILTADSATWDDATSSWLLQNGQLRTDISPSSLTTQSVPQDPIPTAAYAPAPTPQDILLNRSREYVDLLSSSRIRQLLDSSSTYDALDLMRVLHFRFTTLLSNIALMILALACITVRQPVHIRLGIGASLLASAFALGFTFLAQQFASRPPVDITWIHLWPALLAWTPAAALWLAAIFKLDRMPT